MGGLRGNEVVRARPSLRCAAYWRAIRGAHSDESRPLRCGTHPVAPGRGRAGLAGEGATAGLGAGGGAEWPLFWGSGSGILGPAWRQAWCELRPSQSGTRRADAPVAPPPRVRLAPPREPRVPRARSPASAAGRSTGLASRGAGFASSAWPRRDGQSAAGHAIARRAARPPAHLLLLQLLAFHFGEGICARRHAQPIPLLHPPKGLCLSPGTHCPASSRPPRPRRCCTRAAPAAASRLCP